MPPKSTHAQSRKRARWLWLALATATLIGVLLVVSEAEDTVDIQATQTPPKPPVVSIITVAPETVVAQVSGFAEVRPRWETDIRSAVSGRITEVYDGALAGAQVNADAALMSIEKTQYKSAVAVAEMELEEAKLALLRAQNDVIVARKQFARDGTTPPAALALRLPQLKIAEKAAASARAQLETARRALADTHVTAPFAGVVTQRIASLGQTVTPGDPLVRLSDNSAFELSVDVTPTEWALLKHPVSGQRATLSQRDGRPLGVARIRSGGGFLDPTTRQMRLFLERLNASQKLLAGDFLRVTVPGRSIAHTLTVPECAVSRAGFLWWVDADNLLRRTRPDILFRSGGTITLRAPEGGTKWRVAKTPLSSFLPGQRVTPIEGTDR